MSRSVCWYKAERPQQTKSCVIQPGLTYGSQHLEVNLQPIAKRGANRTEALVSLYWSSRSLHLKKPPNRITHKSTNVDPIRSSETWKKSDQLSKSYALQHIKTFILKNTRSTNVPDWSYKWGRHTLLKICGKFLVFPSVIKMRQFTLKKSYQHQSIEVKWTGITNQQIEMINST